MSQCTPNIMRNRKRLRKESLYSVTEGPAKEMMRVSSVSDLRLSSLREEASEHVCIIHRAFYKESSPKYFGGDQFFSVWLG
jgi:hypothetical protein